MSGYQARRIGEGVYEYRGHRIERTRPEGPVYPWLITYPDGRKSDVPRLKDAKWHVDMDIAQPAKECTCGAMEYAGCDCGLSVREYIASRQRQGKSWAL